MYYIEQLHSNHKILKLGIKYALYGKPRAEGTTRKSFAKEINKINEEWHKSWFIAYLKEPPWKAGNTIYNKEGKKFIIKDIGNREYRLLGGKYGGIYKLKYIKENYSHYYPGQQVESFKYVRAQFQVPYDGSDKFYEWQKVEEEKEMISDGQHEYCNPQYTQFQEDVDKGKILAEI